MRFQAWDIVICQQHSKKSKMKLFVSLFTIIVLGNGKGCFFLFFLSQTAWAREWFVILKKFLVADVLCFLEDRERFDCFFYTQVYENHFAMCGPVMLF